MSSDDYTPQSGVCDSRNDRRDPDPDEERESDTWARAEEHRRENVDQMDGIDSVQEMMARRGLPPAEGE